MPPADIDARHPPLTRPWRRLEKVGLALIATLAIGLRILLAWHAPWPIGYVYDFYHEPIISYYQTGQMPTADDCWQCYHPPVYTRIGGAVFSAAMKLTGGNMERALWWLAFLSVPISLIFLGSCYGVMRQFVSDPRHLLPLIALIASLPLIFISSFAVESDLLCATFAVSALALYLRYRRQPRMGWTFAGMAGLAGLALGTKYSGLVIVAVIGALIAWDLLRSRAWNHIGHLAAFGAICLALGGSHYIDNLRTHGTPIVGNQAWDHLAGKEKEGRYKHQYEFFTFRWMEFLDLMADDSPQKTLRHFPAYNSSVLTSLYGQLWTDGSIFSNPSRHGLAKGLYPDKDIPTWIVHSLFAAGLILVPLAGIGLIVMFRRWSITLPLLLISTLTLTLYVRWFVSYPIWMLKTKYLLALAPVALVCCAWGLEWLESRYPQSRRVYAVGIYILTLLANAYCFGFATP